MCEPATLALALGGTAISAGSSVYGAFQQKKAGRDQRDVAYRNAALAEQAGLDAERRGGQAANLIRLQGRQILAKQKTAFAASGVDVSTGSPVDVMAATAGMNELDALTARNNAAREAWGYRVQATQLRQQGEYAEKYGSAQSTGTLLTTAGSVASNSAELYRRRPKIGG